MPDDSSAQPAEPWQRFTLLDVLLLQAGFALGFSSMCLKSLDHLSWGLRIPAALLLGAVLAGPIVLAVQRVVRGRQRLPSLGEWLWLSPFVLSFLGTVGVIVIRSLYLLTATPPGVPVLSAVYLSSVLLAVLMIIAEAACALAGLLVVLAGMVGTRPKVPCSWTDWFGAATCFLLGAALMAYYFLAAT